MAIIDRANMGRLPKDPKKMLRTPKGAVLYQLFAAARSARAMLDEELAALELHAGQERFLAILAEETSLAPRLIADRLGVRAQTITRTVQRLEARGFVTRTPSKEDGRAVEITLTDRGYEVLGAARKAAKRVEKRMLASFDKKQSKQCLRLLEQLDIAVSRDEDGATGG